MNFLASSIKTNQCQIRGIYNIHKFNPNWILKSSYGSQWCSPRWWINVILAGSKVAQICSIEDSHWFNVSVPTMAQMALIILVPVVFIPLYATKGRMEFGSSVNYDIFCHWWLFINQSFHWTVYKNHIDHILFYRVWKVT